MTQNYITSCIYLASSNHCGWMTLLRFILQISWFRTRNYLWMRLRSQTRIWFLMYLPAPLYLGIVGIHLTLTGAIGFFFFPSQKHYFQSWNQTSDPRISSMWDILDIMHQYLELVDDAIFSFSFTLLKSLHICSHFKVCPFFSDDTWWSYLVK